MEKKKKNDELPAPLLPVIEQMAGCIVQHSIRLLALASVFIYFSAYMGIGNWCTGTGTAGTFLVTTLICENSWFNIVSCDSVFFTLLAIVLWYVVDDAAPRTREVTRFLIFCYLFPGRLLLLAIASNLQVHPMYTLAN